MKLYYAPNACSIGIHIVLEEIGAEFEAQAIDLRSGQQNSDAFRAINPKGKIPALVRDDDTLLTEFGAIAFWLAQTYPQAGLLSSEMNQQTQTLELLDYIVGTVHMRGLTFVINPQKFAEDQGGQDYLRAHGKQVAQAGLESLSTTLGAKDYLQGEFGIADAALFYVTYWAMNFGLEVPENLTGFYDRMMRRPAVKRVFAREKTAASP